MAALKSIFAVLEAARTGPNGALFVMVEAFYRPHGGNDGFMLMLALDHDQIKRVRTPREGKPLKVEQDLNGEERARIQSDLAALQIWEMPDALETMMDGLAADVVFVQGERVRTVRLLRGTEASAAFNLLQYLSELAPHRRT